MKYKKHYLSGSAVNPVLQMVIFILAIGLLGLLGYRQLDRVITPRRTVVVLAEALKAGDTLNPEHLAMSEVRTKHLTAAALDDPGLVVGRALARDKRSGDPLYPSDMARTAAAPRSPLSSQVPEGRVITTLTLPNLTIPYSELKNGDRIDILSAGNNRRGAERVSSVVVRDAYVLGYLAPPVQKSSTGRGLLASLGANTKKKSSGPAGLMLAIRPEDVLALAELDGSGAHLTLALHNIQTVKDNQMLTVERRATTRDVDVILGTKRETVTIDQ